VWLPEKEMNVTMNQMKESNETDAHPVADAFAAALRRAQA